jgi:hypothetical protein
MVASEKQKSQRNVQVAVRPRSLAQALCPHLHRQLVMWDVDSKTKTNMCLDCNKHIEESNDCAHEEVRMCVVETVGKQLVPRCYGCDLCGVELEMKDLPKSVRIVHLNVNDSAASDH